VVEGAGESGWLPAVLAWSSRLVRRCARRAALNPFEPRLGGSSYEIPFLELVSQVVEIITLTQNTLLYSLGFCISEMIPGSSKQK